MSSKNKKLLLAIFGALMSWVICLYIWGLGVDKSFTASGPVVMTDPSQVYKALEDPTFQQTVSWGAITISQKVMGAITVAAPLTSFILILIFSFRKK